jgi:hypothetical protein
MVATINCQGFKMAGTGPNLARRSCAAISDIDLRAHTTTSN